MADRKMSAQEMLHEAGMSSRPEYYSGRQFLRENGIKTTPVNYRDYSRLGEF